MSAGALDQTYTYTQTHTRTHKMPLIEIYVSDLLSKSSIPHIVAVVSGAIVHILRLHLHSNFSLWFSVQIVSQMYYVDDDLFVSRMLDNRLK